MNDRYLYRAKRTDNGEWVEGTPLFYQDGSMTIYGQKQAQTVGFHIQNNGYCDRNTLCQCTGLRDKNGKLIWENDIMVAHLDDVFPEDETYKRVLWHNNGFYTNENHSKYIDPIDEFDKNHFEVCGNLFDNPELLEVGE